MALFCGAVLRRCSAAICWSVFSLCVVVLRVVLRRALRVSRARYRSKINKGAGVYRAQDCNITILAEGAIALPVTLSGGVLFAS